jgi:signal transduction histidine kinase
LGAVRRAGLQAEVLASLAIVMILASVVLGAVLVRVLANHYEARETQLRKPLARVLSIATRDPQRGAALLGVDVNVWTVSRNGTARARSVQPQPIDAESLELAEEARAAAAALFHLAANGEPIRFAAPLDAGEDVVVVRLPAAGGSASGAATSAVLAGVLVINAVIFTLLGGVLLRRRVISPLRRLSGAARAVEAGGFDARLPIEGTREMAELTSVFNDMTEALAKRTGALEKAVSDLRDANRRLRRARVGLDRAERLASVGSLAAGVAHEVGNPMGALLAFLDLVGRDPNLSEESRQHLAQAREQGGRVRSILRQLLDFSSPPRAVLEPVDLASIAAQTAAMVRAQRRYAGVEIEVLCEGVVEPVCAESGVVAQILLNLVLNAADAVHGRAAPRVELRIRAIPLQVRDGEDGTSAGKRRHFDAVECLVTDNGPGIPAELRERIFAPFFTTKPPGEGTGLGLANALRLAEEMGGQLELLDPEPGRGGCFALRLPVASGEVEPGSARGGDAECVAPGEAGADPSASA